MDQTSQQLNDLLERFKQHNHDDLDTQPIRKTVFVTASLAGTASATGANYGVFFVATRPCVVVRISEVHTTAGSSTPTLQVEKLTGTTALDSGSTLLKTAFNLASTANTVQTGDLIDGGTKTALSMNKGDRLALKDIGTLTAIAGVCVTVEIEL
jgi:hypothetical protein